MRTGVPAIQKPYGFRGDDGSVNVDGVRKRFTRRGRWVLDGVDLLIPPGACTVIAAANGAGKSTLLRIVAGASVPTAGRVRGRPGTVAYVPERAPVRLRMTARQYLAHMGRLRGLPAGAVRARAEELSERLALAPGPDVQISALSKGNSQKVALMQAFLRPVELLVVDEPYTGLDAPASGAVRELLAEAAAAGTAVLVSAHESVGGDFLLRDGRLTPLVSKPDRVLRVVLVAVDGRASPGDLAAHTLTLTGDRERLVVRTADADRLLAHALAVGWSLVEARPEEPR
jgi:ABC-type Mn2+/Zn2+ transport system ATPase subunit